MQFYFKINGVDFTPYIVRSGLTMEQVVRKSRRVTVLNGTDYRAEISKIRGAVQLMTVTDEVWEHLRAAITSNPVNVEYTDAGGNAVVKLFYVLGMREPVREVRGGRTYYRGITFTMEEK